MKLSVKKHKLKKNKNKKIHFITFLSKPAARGKCSSQITTNCSESITLLFTYLNKLKLLVTFFCILLKHTTTKD